MAVGLSVVGLPCSPPKRAVAKPAAPALEEMVRPPRTVPRIVSEVRFIAGALGQGVAHMGIGGGSARSMPQLSFGGSGYTPGALSFSRVKVEPLMGISAMPRKALPV